ncbi:hypothetical protein [Paludibaculum fermentans]|uniref:hypothetical protein n=1 Tax=Paludibaculum fermentans TaxID=1473598 RepID=UPI003EBC5A73
MDEHIDEEQLESALLRRCTPDQMTEIQAHLAECALCSQRAEKLREYIDHLRAAIIAEEIDKGSTSNSST